MAGSCLAILSENPKEKVCCPGNCLRASCHFRPVVPAIMRRCPLSRSFSPNPALSPGDVKDPPRERAFVAVLWRVVLDVPLEVGQRGGFPHPRPAEEDVVLGGIKSKAVYEDVLQLANGARFNGQFVLEGLFLRYDDTRERVPGEVVKGHEHPMQLKYLNFAT